MEILQVSFQVDIDAPDALRKWPDLRDAPYFECEVKAGEMIYIPMKWYFLVLLLPLLYNMWVENLQVICNPVM